MPTGLPVSATRELLPNQRRDDVSTPHPDYIKMARKWELLHDLDGGTQRMRDARETWLPREPGEQPDDYNIRIDRSILFNAFSDTIEAVINKPYTRPISFEFETGNQDERIAALPDDIDRSGLDITQFGRKNFKSAVFYGIGHILVDFPTVPSDATLADELLIGARPFFVNIPAPDLIGWESEIRGNKKVLTQIRIKEEIVVPDGQWKVKKLQVVRVINEFSFEMWVKPDERTDFIMEFEGPNSLGKVPLVTYYTRQTGFLTADPPLEDLAWLNLAHWQSYSDQRNILRVARIPILFERGVTAEEMDEPIVIGSGRATKSISEKADMKFVEHSGAAINSGRQDIMDIENRMEQFGKRPFIEKTGNVTATSAAIDEARTHSSAQSWVRAQENALEEAIILSGEWIGVEVDVKIDIFSDFVVSPRAKDDGNIIQQARDNRDISHQTYLQELKRRSTLSEDLDIEEEKERLQEEQKQEQEINPQDRQDSNNRINIRNNNNRNDSGSSDLDNVRSSDDVVESVDNV